MNIPGVINSFVFTNPRSNYLLSCDIEKSPPPEFKYGNERVLENDLKLPHIPKVKDKDDKGKWVNKIFSELNIYRDTVLELQKKGYTKDEAKAMLDKSIKISEGSTQWALTNETNCTKSASAILLALPFGVLQSVLNHLDFIHPSFKIFNGFLHNFFIQIRNYFQYKTYSGIKDEKGKNNYEAEVYGNKPVGTLANLACFTEIKLGWLRAIAGLFGDRLFNAFEPLSNLPKLVWFRARLASDINQKFLSHFLDYVIHKPLSLLGIKKSKDIVSQINNEGFLKPNYLIKRTSQNLGLTKENTGLRDIASKSFKDLKAIFSKSKPLEERIDSSKNIARAASPFLGLYASSALLLGTPVKSTLSYFGLNNNYLNSFCHSGISAQHIIYAFKFVIPEYYENKLLEYSDTDLEVNKLKNERNKLFPIGISSCIINLLSVGFKLFNIENKYLKMARDFYDGIADKSISYYFSKRRKLLGRKHGLANPELYNLDGTQKIISDKLSEKLKSNKVQEENIENTIGTKEDNVEQEKIKKPVVRHLVHTCV